MLQSVIDSILVLAVLLNLAMLATSRLAACIRTFALQSLLLALLPIAVGLRHETMPGAHTFAGDQPLRHGLDRTCPSYRRVPSSTTSPKKKVPPDVTLATLRPLTC